MVKSIIRIEPVEGHTEDYEIEIDPDTIQCISRKDFDVTIVYGAKTTIVIGARDREEAKGNFASLTRQWALGKGLLQ